jgi:hypothetical protein
MLERFVTAGVVLVAAAAVYGLVANTAELAGSDALPTWPSYMWLVFLLLLFAGHRWPGRTSKDQSRRADSNR